MKFTHTHTHTHTHDFFLFLQLFFFFFFFFHAFTHTHTNTLLLCLRPWFVRCLLLFALNGSPFMSSFNWTSPHPLLLCCV
ncbi:hypothetical protein BKA57DRAFT_305305 [Linnemannia elongata]|nr:hypothetical protein BKA57DRAFT_305305 [Linnemannia elongata]